MNTLQRASLLLPLLLGACGTPTLAPPQADRSAPQAGVVLPAVPTQTAPQASASATVGAAQMATGNTNEPPPLLLGLAVAQTGELSVYGTDQERAASLAVDALNANGGINGRPVQLVITDTGDDEQGAVRAFQQLIDQGVAGIIGPIISAQAFAAHPVADAAGVPVLGPSTTAPGIPEIGPYVARVAAPDTEVAPYAVNAALTINPAIRRVVALYDPADPFTRGETAVFQRAVTETYGLELVATGTFADDDQSFAASRTLIEQTKPDLVIVSGLVSSARLVRVLREQGYTGMLIAGDGLNTGDIFTLCGTACADLLLAQRYSPTQMGPANAALVGAWTRAFDTSPPPDAGLVWAAVQVFGEALIDLDRTTPLAGLSLAQLRDQLNTQLLGGTYDTPLGRISFTPDGEVRQDRFYATRVAMNVDGATGQFIFLSIGNGRR